MSQEPYKEDNKTRLPRFNNRSNNTDGDDGQRKGPRFSIYWVYAIIFAVLIGFQVFGPFTPSTKEIRKTDFEQMMKQGDIEKYTIISNRNVVRVVLKKEALPKYSGELGKEVAENEAGPHFYFRIVSGDSFQDDMRK